MVGVGAFRVVEGRFWAKFHEDVLGNGVMEGVETPHYPY